MARDTSVAAAAAKPRRLRTHLVALVTAALLPAFAVGAVAVRSAVDSYRAAFEARLTDTARALAGAVDAEVRAHVAALSALATARGLDDGQDPAAFHERARRLADLLGAGVSVTTPPPDLRVVLHTRYPPGEPIPDTLLERARRPGSSARRAFATGRPVVGDLVHEPAGGRWVAPVQVPVIRDGRLVCALGVGLKGERLARVLQAQDFRNGGGYATVVDARGTIVARSAEYDRYVGEPVAAWLADAVARSADGAGLLHGANRAGVATVTAFRRLAAAPGWFVAVVEPLAGYRAGLWRPLAALALGGLGVLAAALVAAVAIGRRIVGPVDALTRQAEAVAAGGAAAGGAAAAAGTPEEASPPAQVAEFARLRAAVLGAQAALAESAARLKAVVDTAVDAIVVIDERGVVQAFNKAAEGIFGRAADEVIGRNVSMLMPEPDAARHDGYLERYRATGERRIIGIGREVAGRRKDGSTVPLDLSSAEWRDARGRRFFTGMMRDITLRKEVEARQRILMREVDHRAKNALAVVQSVVRLTRAEDPRAYAAAVEARVAALARAHTLLAEQGWAGADLRALVAVELAPYGATSISLVGPAVPIAHTAAQPIGMVLHELATNAAKHGALSRAGGVVALRWRVEGGGLRLHWEELGGPAVAGAPRRRGFGARLIEATVQRQLGGHIECRWPPEGLVCAISLPLARVIAPAEVLRPTIAAAAIGASRD